jgi:alpha-mannosidase
MLNFWPLLPKYMPIYLIQNIGKIRIKIYLLSFDVVNHILCSYPQNEVTRLWKLICLNQFHDCLPGSAINIAYIDVHKVTANII